MSSKAVELQHNVIGVSGNSKAVQPNSHPDAQWFLKGGNLGLFIHYGISTVDGAIDLSWGMIPNKPWEKPMGVNRYIAHEKYWEHCHIWMIDGGWAHMDNDKGYKPAKWVVDQYKQCKEWNGNFLIDVGPAREGTLPPIFYQRMEETKKLLIEEELI